MMPRERMTPAILRYPLGCSLHTVERAERIVLYCDIGSGIGSGFVTILQALIGDVSADWRQLVGRRPDGVLVAGFAEGTLCSARRIVARPLGTTAVVGEGHTGRQREEEATRHYRDSQSYY